MTETQKMSASGDRTFDRNTRYALAAVVFVRKVSVLRAVPDLRGLHLIENMYINNSYTSSTGITPLTKA